MQYHSMLFEFFSILFVLFILISSFFSLTGFKLLVLVLLFLPSVPASFLDSRHFVEYVSPSSQLLPLTPLLPTVSPATSDLPSPTDPVYREFDFGRFYMDYLSLPCLLINERLSNIPNIIRDLMYEPGHRQHDDHAFLFVLCLFLSVVRPSTLLFSFPSLLPSFYSAFLSLSLSLSFCLFFCSRIQGLPHYNLSAPAILIVIRSEEDDDHKSVMPNQQQQQCIGSTTGGSSGSVRDGVVPS